MHFRPSLPRRPGTPPKKINTRRPESACHTPLFSSIMGILHASVNANGREKIHSGHAWCAAQGTLQYDTGIPETGNKLGTFKP